MSAIPDGTRTQFEDRSPVNFFSIEIVTPAHTFWEGLARLLSRLGAAARHALDRNVSADGAG